MFYVLHLHVFITLDLLVWPNSSMVRAWWFCKRHTTIYACQMWLKSHIFPFQKCTSSNWMVIGLHDFVCTWCLNTSPKCVSVKNDYTIRKFMWDHSKYTKTVLGTYSLTSRSDEQCNCVCVHLHKHKHTPYSLFLLLVTASTKNLHPIKSPSLNYISFVLWCLQVIISFK